MITSPTPEQDGFNPGKHCGLPPSEQAAYDNDVVSALSDIDRSLSVLAGHAQPKDETTTRIWRNGHFITVYEDSGDKEKVDEALARIDTID